MSAALLALTRGYAVNEIRIKDVNDNEILEELWKSSRGFKTN